SVGVGPGGKNQIGDGEKQGEDARNKASTPTAQRHAAPPRRQPPGPPRRRRRRSPLLLPHRARLPVRSSPAAAAPRLRLPQRLGTSAAAPLLALALHLACPRLRGRGVRLRGGGEARDLHGGRAALRARARHRVAARALEAPKRNHPLMLLSGVATNAVGFDLSPGASFARHMSMQGFDTWIVELRGAGLSTRGSELAAASTKSDMSSNSDKFLGLMELPQTSAIYDQISQLSQRLVKILGEGQQNVSPRLFGWQERLSATIEDLQKQLELIISYDWDFDHYLEEDVPAAIDYIKQQSVPKDGKLLAIGHSMGGILLYAMVSKCGFEGADPELAAIVTLASSVDYTTSNSSLKLFVPLADPAEMLRVPAVPLGTLLSTTYPISSRAPYILSLLRSQISAKDMMDPELLSKLILNNFCTVPAKVLLQLATSFRDGGLRNRAGTFFFKEHLGKIKVPVLALAGDEDLICPPEAVYETVKVIPQHLVTYKVFGKPEGPHYAHYDLVGGRKAVHEVYPCIIEFLSQHDDVSS
uniref:AB hydrolase-1 domain-containing protein n=2 Tax=Aegilops tauschii subsp. strangulata TaxID=200361 RepID=A0A453FBC8_AEGTS